MLVGVQGANEVQVFSGDLSTFPTPCTRIPAERVNAFLASVEVSLGCSVAQCHPAGRHGKAINLSFVSVGEQRDQCSSFRPIHKR